MAGSGTPFWDRVLVSLIQLLFMALLVVGGLDAGRHHWTSLPIWLQAVGFVLMIAGLLGVGWAMGQNPYFESTVRIQEDRAQHVIDTGPYRLVRHPGYSAALILMLGMPLVLGSAWALVPAALMVVVLVVRTAKEDRFLQANLQGYREFAQRTRYRLIPGVW
jgi:protein-S-isoprenylcysteine O-methyltransferase Ste14